MPLRDTSQERWRRRLTAIAVENGACYLSHPWAATSDESASPGPRLIAKYEHVGSAAGAAQGGGPTTLSNAYDFGLERVLDGLEARIRIRRESA